MGKKVQTQKPKQIDILSSENEGKLKNVEVIKSENVKPDISEKTPELYVNGSVAIENELTVNGVNILDILKSINDKLEILIDPNKHKLENMSVTELNNLTELLNRNILINNYPGGNNDIKIKSNDLMIKIENELNNRINLYI